MANKADTEQLEKSLQSGDTQVLDVRDEEDFSQAHIRHENATVLNVYYKKFAFQPVEKLMDEFSKEEPVYVVCWEGDSSKKIAELLRKKGFDARNIEGGMESWNSL
ncbi:MAG: rhodanese-like domain-containing protein [Nanohaloarchaea archaeon]|nr:rhodanese-like domain-containing protein [Candidatus Nanohaloarchaea archaeon]